MIYFKIEFPKSTRSNFCLISFGGAINFRHFLILFHWNISSYKIEKNGQSMTPFRTPTRFEFLDEEL